MGGVASQISTLLPSAITSFPVSLLLSFLLAMSSASTSYFLHAAMNLCPPSVTVSTHTSAFDAVAFQSPAMPNARMSLWTQSVHSFSFPPRPLRNAPSRFPKTIRFGSRPQLIRRSVHAVPAGVTQEESHTGFLIHLPSAVHAFIFLARRIQSLFLSLVDREVEFCVLTI